MQFVYFPIFKNYIPDEKSFRNTDTPYFSAEKAKVFTNQVWSSFYFMLNADI